MRKILAGVLVSLVIIVFSVKPTHTIEAAPLMPQITVEIEPKAIRPAQAGYIYVGGTPGMDVNVTMDGTTMPMFWAGHGYQGFMAFDFDAEPGPRAIVVSVLNPVTGESITINETVEVANYTYPLEQVGLPFALEPLLDPDLNNEENAELTAVFEGLTTPANFDWPFSTPVPFGIVTSRFGGDRVYNSGKWQQYHTGADFRRTIGEPIYAVANGRVAATLPLQIYGNVMIVDHGYGVYSLYAHNSEWYFAVGDEVQKGQVIAAAGATGRTNGPHLHWEVIVNGVKVDPLAFLALDPEYVPLREARPDEE